MGGLRQVSSSWDQSQRRVEGGLIRGGRRKRLDTREDRMERTFPRRGGGGSMITYSAEKYPSDPVSCLFERLFSDFLNACMLSFDVIMINNDLCPLVFFHHCFRRLGRIFFLLVSSVPMYTLCKV